MKPITVLAVSLMALSLSACTSTPRVPLQDLAALSPTDKNAATSLPIYNDAQLSGKEYVVLGMVEGYACKTYEFGPAVSKLDAIEQVKYWAKGKGANAVVNIQCDPPRQSPLGTGCYESITCVAQAVVLK